MKITVVGWTGCTLVSGFILGMWGILSLWTDRTLEFWLSTIKGEPVDVPYLISALVTLVLNAVILVINIVSEIIRLVM